MGIDDFITALGEHEFGKYFVQGVKLFYVHDKHATIPQGVTIAALSLNMWPVLIHVIAEKSTQGHNAVELYGKITSDLHPWVQSYAEFCHRYNEFVVPPFKHMSEEDIPAAYRKPITPEDILTIFAYKSKNPKLFHNHRD